VVPVEVKEEGNCVTASVVVTVLKPVGGAVVPAGEGAPVDVSRLVPWVDIKVGKAVGEPVGVTIVDELVTCSVGGVVGNGVVGDAVNGMEDDPDP